MRALPLLLIGCVTLEDYVGPKDDVDTDTLAEAVVADTDVVPTPTPTPTPQDTSPPPDTDPPEPQLHQRPLILVEVADGSTHPWKFVQVFNPGDLPTPMGDYTLEKFSNGGGPPDDPDGVYVFPDADLPAGASFVVAYDQSDVQFEAVFGRPAHDYSGVVDGNGDDVYVLREDGLLRDIYGVFDSSGPLAWDYRDQTSQRDTAVLEGRSQHALSEWTLLPAHHAAPFHR
jgi:hypothetical protein